MTEVNRSAGEIIDSAEPAAGSSAPAKLWNKNYFLLWQGQFVSQLGNQVHAIAMMFWVKHATGSATLMGTLMMIATLPGVILGPLGGTFADRHSRRLIIIFSDLISGILILGLAMSIYFLPGKTEFTITIMMISYLAIGIISAAFNPSISAAIPDLVPPEKIAAANSMRQSSFQIASLFGQGLGGVLFRILGAAMLMFFDAISFFISAVAAFFIKIPQKLPEKSTGFREVINHFKRDTTEGFRYVWASMGLRALIFMAAFINFFVAPIGVLLPFYIEDTLKATPDWFGYFLALLGGGALIGYLIMGVIKLPGRFRGLLVLSSIASFAVIIGLLGVVKSVYPALGLSFFMGMFVGIANLNISVVLQATTPTEIRGRVFGLLSTVGGGLAPISMGLAGVILDLTGKNLSLIFGFSGGITLIFTAILVFNRDFKQFLSYDAPVAPAASK